jgi:hypothetical protein
MQDQEMKIVTTDEVLAQELAEAGITTGEVELKNVYDNDEDITALAQMMEYVEAINGPGSGQAFLRKALRKVRPKVKLRDRIPAEVQQKYIDAAKENRERKNALRLLNHQKSLAGRKAK